MPTGTILAYSIPDGAEILIDGSSPPTRFGFARTPAVIPEVFAGIHNVIFRLPGYIDEIKSISVPQGGYSTVNAVLRPVK